MYSTDVQLSKVAIYRKFSGVREMRYLKLSIQGKQEEGKDKALCASSSPYVLCLFLVCLLFGNNVKIRKYFVTLEI